MTSDVLATVEGRTGRLRLNRPKALHALTEPMCAAMIEALLAWRADERVDAVLIDHAEGRGFCAGGDVRAAAESGRGDGQLARDFFHTEYRLNHLLFVYAKPVAAVMDGVVMGGGVGVALPARYRIATERTLLAMPETTIGLFPDVGGGRYLSHLPGRLGPYLALTAARATGADCLDMGLATHWVPSDGLETFKRALVETAAARWPELLEGAAGRPEPGPLAARRPEIDRLFAADTLEAILADLAADGGEWAAETRASLDAKSPLSCKVALRLLREAAPRIDFADEMRAEYGIATHLCQRPDFAEGVRALLVDKDNRPRWDPATPEGVTEHMLDTIFAPLPEADAWEPLRL
jgi:enoyl-CoA hydratase